MNFEKFRRAAAKKSGFTMMEILVVIIILGILVAIGGSQYQKALERSREAEATTMLGNIATAERMYYMQYDEFTPNFANLMLKIPVHPKTGEDAANFSIGRGQGFDYDITMCAGEECTLRALRGTGDTHKYEIRMSGISNEGTAGTRTCHSTDRKGIKICKLLCGGNIMPDEGGACVMD